MWSNSTLFYNVKDLTEICRMVALLKPCNCHLGAGSVGLDCTKIHEACQEAEDLIQALGGDDRQ
eukprot:10760864-Prorocentrum_lima.AAC.1